MYEAQQAVLWIRFISCLKYSKVNAFCYFKSLFSDGKPSTDDNVRAPIPQTQGKLIR